MMDFNELLSGLSWLVALVVILGIALLIFELVTPTFGIIGATGVVLIIIGVGAMSQMVSFPVLVAIIALILTVIVGVLILTYRSATKGGISKTLVLKTTEGKDQGYVGVDEFKEMVGREGVALTQLRPTGIGEFDGLNIDVVTEGDFIPKGSKIRIIEVKGYRTIVSKNNR